MKSDSREKLSEMTQGHSFELYFEVSSIIDLQKQLQQMQVKFALEVYIPPWGQRTIQIFDPDGYLIEISEKMEDVIIRMKDEGHSIEEIHQKTMMPIEIIKKTLAEQ